MSVLREELDRTRGAARHRVADGGATPAEFFASIYETRQRSLEAKGIVADGMSAMIADLRANGGVVERVEFFETPFSRFVAVYTRRGPQLVELLFCMREASGAPLRKLS